MWLNMLSDLFTTNDKNVLHLSLSEKKKAYKFLKDCFEYKQIYRKYLKHPMRNKKHYYIPLLLRT